MTNVLPMTTTIVVILTLTELQVFAAEPDNSTERGWASLADSFTPPKSIPGAECYPPPLTFDDGRPVRTAADWAERRKEILADWHGRMGEWPPLLDKPTVEVLKTEDRDDGITQHHVRIQVAADRTNDDAYLLVPPGDGPFPAVVVVYYDAATGIGRGKTELRDYAIQLARRGFVTLSLGSSPYTYYPNKDAARLQPLSYHAYVAANCHQLLANRPDVDGERIGIMGHSYGGKWAMFAACLYDKFAAAAWSDPGIVFDESRPSVNYWEPWYLGYEPGVERKRGVVTQDNPRTGPYKRMVADGRDLHELHALMAPRPFLVSGGSEDPPERWAALSSSLAVYKMLNVTGRVGMTNRPTHSPTDKSNEQIYAFFEHFMKHPNSRDE